MISFSSRIAAVVTLAGVFPAAADDSAGLDFFEKKIRPLLVERCLECHSPEHKIKGGLRLDHREGWQTGGDAGPALVPGKPDESLLLTALRYRDPDLKMPPKKPLAPAEVALFEEWIRLGAPDPRTATATAKKASGMTLEDGRKFWAYIPPRRPSVPEVRDTDWPRGDLDRFILADLERRNLRPRPDAAPAALERRRALTLTGLPPSALASTGLDALLASPHYGERFGRHWLDVARFAESSGGGRSLLYKDAWRYRDYVIEAFNADRPYDQFLREQIAGDLLPAADTGLRQRQLIATAFLVLGPTNYEEQDKQQLRFDVIDEQLDSIGKTVLGQTIGCARCHDHKFDPISQRDYYAMAGVFASTRTLLNYTDNVARWIDAPLPVDAEKDARFSAEETQLAAAKNERDALKKEFNRRKAKLARAAGPVRNYALADLPGIVVDDSQAKAIGAWTESKLQNGFVGDGYRHDNNDGKGTKTLTFAPRIPAAGRYEVRLAYNAHASRASRLPVNILHAAGEETVYVDQTQPPAIDGVWTSLGTFPFEKDGAGFVLVTNEGTSGFVIADAVQFLPADQAGAATGIANNAELESLEKRMSAVNATISSLEKSVSARPICMAVNEDEKPADTHIRVRGIQAQRGALVPRGVPAVLSAAGAPVFSTTGSGRRELADWLVSRENPLTARVIVNRVWQWMFGEGLVPTPDNFGTTGTAPTHPELLDFLALDFMEHGWSIKRLVRQIAESRTWQQTAATPRRLDAEQLRDSILAISGGLDLALGGPNIEGAGVVDANDTSSQNTEYRYEFKDTRRSVYAPAFRNRRLELFEVFDFADINSPIGRRAVSTVAPQALYFLNHPFVLTESRRAADRAMAEPGTDAERLTRAFVQTLGRPPRPAEQAACLKTLEASAATAATRKEAWSQVFQSLFGCVDFRYLD